MYSQFVKNSFTQPLFVISVGFKERYLWEVRTLQIKQILFHTLFLWKCCLFDWLKMEHLPHSKTGWCNDYCVDWINWRLKILQKIHTAVRLAYQSSVWPRDFHNKSPLAFEFLLQRIRGENIFFKPLLCSYCINIKKY